METNKLTQEKKRHAVIAPIHAKNNDLENLVQTLLEPHLCALSVYFVSVSSLPRVLPFFNDCYYVSSSFIYLFFAISVLYFIFIYLFVYLFIYLFF